MERKLVYLAGPITGVERYWEPFEQAQDDLTALGYTALTPTWQPKGLTYAQYMRICMAMIDICDAVVLLPGGEQSRGATLESHYCETTGKTQIELPERKIGDSYRDYMERLCRLMAEHVPQEEAQSDGHDGMA